MAADTPLYSLDEFPSAVHGALREFLHQRRGELAHIGQPVSQVASYLERFVLDGGKRIRPLYMWAGFLGSHNHRSTEDPEAVLRAAAALELIQACALIHDDIIDASDTRRGHPAVHRQISDDHRNQNLFGSSAHFGTSVAILLGDMALAWADDMFHQSGLSTAALVRAQKPWSAMRREVIGGQILDISLEAHAEESIELADRVNRFKTAAYTIERPLHLGATFADAPQSSIDAFRGYGHDIGIAFQLRDDLLGVFGDPEITGKPAGDDLREGKRTVLVAKALAHADRHAPDDAATLRALLGRTDDSAEIAQMRRIIADSGAVDELEERIDALTESGLAHLTQADISPEATESLIELAHRATRRRS